jgi:hypothetical protein
MNNMINIISATDARRDWSQLIDTVVRDKPQIISRTRDYVLLTDVHLMEDILSAYKFTATKYLEEDNSITLSLNDMDIAVNGSSDEDAKMKLAQDILEYAKDYYSEFHYWSKAPNRKKHVPYVFKALILQDVKKIGEEITWHNGKS